MRGTPRLVGGGSGGTGGGTISGTATATQVAYGASADTLTSDSNFTTNGSTNFNVARTVASGQTGQFQIDSNLFGAGVKGIIAASQTTNRIDGIIFGDLTNFGLSSHSGFVGNVETSGGSHAQTTYMVSDGTDLGSINHNVKDGSGAVYQVTLLTSGLRFGTGSNSWHLPVTRPTIGQVPTAADNLGTILWATPTPPSAPGLQDVLTVDPANAGIAITGTNFLSASSSSSSVLRNANGFSVIGLDNKDQAYLRGVTSGDTAMTDNYIGFLDGAPESHGFYSTFGSGFVYTPSGGPGLDDLVVTGTYTGTPTTLTYTIDSNDSYYVTVAFVGPSSFANNTLTTWSAGMQSATIQNYTGIGTTIELTNCTTAPVPGDTLAQGGNTATVSSVDSGPFDTYSWAGDSFTFFNRIQAGIAGPTNSGTIPTFGSATGHTIGDAWIATGASSAAVQGMLIDYNNRTWCFGDCLSALDGNALVLSSAFHSVSLGNTNSLTQGGIAIGWNAGGNGNNLTAVGSGSGGSGDNNVTIGASALSNGFSSVVLLGVGAAAYSDNVFSTAASSRWFVGPEATTATYALGSSIYGPQISVGQTDRNGAPLVTAGGAGTGTGHGGSYVIQAALPGSTGGSRNAYVDILTIDGTTGQSIFSQGNISINTVPYDWTAVQGSVDDVLINDGSGGLSWGPVTMPFSSLTGTPTTLAGYGITDAAPAQTHTIFTPTTGSTVNLVNNTYNAINPAGAILALTLNFPSSPANNDAVEVKFDKGVTTVSYSGGTVVGGITTAALGDYVKFVYDAGTSTWY